MPSNMCSVFDQAIKLKSLWSTIFNSFRLCFIYNYEIYSQMNWVVLYIKFRAQRLVWLLEIVDVTLTIGRIYLAIQMNQNWQSIALLNTYKILWVGGFSRIG